MGKQPLFIIFTEDDLAYLDVDTELVRYAAEHGHLTHSANVLINGLCVTWNNLRRFNENLASEKTIFGFPVQE